MLAWLQSLFRRQGVPLVLYTRADCGLCDEMKAEIARAGLGQRAELREVDVAGDPELEARYGRSLPVLTIGGRLAFKGRLTAGELARKFERLGAEWRRAHTFEQALREVRAPGEQALREARGAGRAGAARGARAGRAREGARAPRGGRLMPQLFVLSSADVGRSFAVEPGDVIGRHPSCAVRLRDPSISRRHAHFEEQGGLWWLVDDGSRNGISAGGVRAPRCALADGNEVAVGEVRLRFRLAAPQAGAAAELEGLEPGEIELEPGEIERSLGETALRPADEPEFVVGGGAGARAASAPAPRPSARPAPAAPSALPAADLGGRAPSPTAAGPRERVLERGPRLLQYHKVEERGGFLTADLAQYPAWVRWLALLGVAAVALALGALAFRAGGLFAGPEPAAETAPPE